MRIGKSNKDNTMAKRKRTNNDIKNIHLKLKIDLHDNVIPPFFKQEPLMCKDGCFEFCYFYTESLFFI